MLIQVAPQYIKLLKHYYDANRLLVDCLNSINRSIPNQ
ncbi:NACHT C-terminal helical domain 2-containing protein [Coleofasciculus sp. E1-EBD-02]